MQRAGIACHWQRPIAILEALPTARLRLAADMLLAVRAGLSRQSLQSRLPQAPA